ncbi:hypothetical protein TeGR_g8134, partial [Tetraparma gracilis]
FSPSTPPTSDLLDLTVTIATAKLADKKLSPSCVALLSSLLSSLGSKHTHSALERVFAAMPKIPSPIAHEALLGLLSSYTSDVGAKKFGQAGLKVLCEYLFSAASHSNPKVKAASSSLVALLHKQMGTPFKLLLLSSPSAKSSAAVKSTFEEIIAKNPHDASAAPSGGGDDEDEDEEPLDVPRADLFASLPKDVLANLAMLEGKNAWKTRLAAMEAITASLKSASHLITSSANVHELLRGLKERLNDSQSNLKPKAANLIAATISSLSAQDAAKCFKLVSTPLMSVSLTDNKKPMRDAAFTALQKCVTMPEGTGQTGTNKSALENCVPALLLCLKNGDAKGAGVPEVLTYFATKASELNKFDPAATTTKEAMREQ